MKPNQGKNTKHIVIDGVPLLNFSGSSYLDLSGNEVMEAAAVRALNQFGLCNDMGYNIAGAPVLEIEAEGADFFEEQAALYCTSAYLATFILVEFIAQRGVDIFIDSQAHFSLFHAARLTGCTIRPFAHRDIADLEASIRKHLRPGMHPLILSDGVFPTWGHIAPIREYCRVAESWDGFVVVDDAHGSGVLGENGRGTTEHEDARSERLHYAASLSKAFGTQGALIPGSHAFVEALRADSPIYNAVSLPTMPTAAAAAAGLRLARERQRRERLWRNAQYLKDGLSKLGFPMESTVVPIATFTTGGADKNRRLFESITKAGFWITLSTYVGAPEERAVRNAVYASHELDEIDQILDCYSRHL